MNAVTILYDQFCPVCRLLASLLAEEAPEHWTFLAWQRYQPSSNAPESWREKRAQELRIVSGADFLEGEAAWSFLLREEPRLQKYQNIAAKLGLSLPTNAKWLRLIGHGLRRLCFSCSWAR
jgi:hypothetical protein